MDQTQLSQTAQQMFLDGAGRKTVIEFLTSNGVPEAEVDEMATKAYRAIREQRQEMINLEAAEPKPMGGGGAGSMILGALFVFGGIVLTMSTDRIWYGLMVVGAVIFFKGLASNVD